MKSKLQEVFLFVFFVACQIDWKFNYFYQALIDKREQTCNFLYEDYSN
ncbi:hypothetical protein NEOC95_001065 [Neochlamydia sp. AcF95]|nr:hypothetical protein [Neochlamydia sp. AcF95]